MLTNCPFTNSVHLLNWNGTIIFVNGKEQHFEWLRLVFQKFILEVYFFSSLLFWSILLSTDLGKNRIPKHHFDLKVTLPSVNYWTDFCSGLERRIVSSTPRANFYEVKITGLYEMKYTELNPVLWHFYDQDRVKCEIVTYFLLDSPG